MRALLFLSDTYPLCTDFGARPFLRRGARYEYLGTSPKPKLQHVTSKFGGAHRGVECLRLGAVPPAVPPDASPSAKGTGAGTGGGECVFKSEVVLDTNLACDGLECDVETVVLVELRDGEDRLL